MDNLNILKMQSPDLNAERLETLKKLFPDLFTMEGRLNPDELKKLIDPEITETERFEFKWFGKNGAKRNAFTPSKATLLYDQTRSVNPDDADGNMIIEGENLESLKCLLSGYREKIKCIYIDPPYNTGKDFVYSDKWDMSKDEYWEHIGVTTDGIKVDTNVDSGGRFHSNWLSMMYSRLLISKELLKDDGLILVSIDENENYHLRKLCNEVFGEDNFCGEFIFDTNHSQQQGLIAIYHEYILVYSKRPSNELSNFTGGEGEIVAGAMKKISRGNPRSEFPFPAGIRCEAKDGSEFSGIWGDTETVELVSGKFKVKNGKTANPMTLAAGWTQKKQMEAIFKGDSVVDTKGQKVLEFYFTATGKLKCRKERSKITPNSILDQFGTISKATEELEKTLGAKSVFPQPKPVGLLSYLVNLITDPQNGEEIILDFFAGSGTIAQAVMELNAKDGGHRKFLLVQIPELTAKDSEAYKAGYKKISDIAIERNKRVVEQLEQADTEESSGLFGEGAEPFKAGFKVYKLAKSNFPRVEFAPDPEKSDEENIELLKQYIKDKEAAFRQIFDEHSVFDEVLLKNGFMLNYAKEKVSDFKKNTVFHVTDADRQCLICLDIPLKKETLKTLEGHKDSIFICLEQALDTTMKWNLKHLLGDKLVAF